MPATGSSSSPASTGAAKTGVPLEMRWGQVWTFRGEQLIRTENYADPAEALEAAGL